MNADKNLLETEKNQSIATTTWMVLIVAWGMNMVINLANFALGVMLPSMRMDLGFGLEAAGVLSATGWIIKAIFTIPITLLITKVNPKRLLSMIMGIASAGLLIQGLSINFATLMVGRLMVLGVAILPPLASIKVALIPQEKMTQVNGYEVFTTPLGQVMGTALVPMLLLAFSGWRNVLLFFGGAGVILTLIWIFGFRGKYEIKDEQAAKDLETGTKGESPFREIIRHKEVWLLSFGWIGTSLVWIAIYTFWPTYATETVGLTLSQSGWILGMLPLGSMIGSLTSPKLADKIGYDKLMIWPWGFILPVAYYTLLITPNIFILGTASFIAGYGAFAFVPIAFTTIYKIPDVNPKAVSIGIAMITTFSGLGGGIGGLIAGRLGETLGLYNAMAVCCLSPLLFGVLTLFLPEYGRKAQEKELQGK